MKTCTGCKEALPLSMFAWRRDREAYATRCKQCQSEHSRNYWHRKFAAIAPDPKVDETRELNACAAGWRYASEPVSLAWRV